MILRDGGAYELTCDKCGEAVECDSFPDAVQYKKDNGWQSVKYGDDWADLCPDCHTRKAGDIFDAV